MQNIQKDISMIPLILPKDKLSIKKSKQYSLDDIVVFLKDEKLIAHRVIYKKDNYFVTKGDNNLSADGKIEKNLIIGKVVKLKRNKDIFSLNQLYLSQSGLYLNALKKVSNHLAKKGFDHVFLKGLPLHLIYSQNKPKRIYYDCDILIRNKDFSPVKKLLKKLGFQTGELLAEKMGVYSSQFSFIKDTKPFPVVIDSHLEPAIGMTKLKSTNKLIPHLHKFTKTLMDNTNKEMLADTKFRVLNKDVFFLYLLLHLFHHNFKGTHRIQFIKELVDTARIDWKKVAKLTNDFEFQTFVYPACLVVNKLYKNTLPKTFLRKIEPKTFSKFLSIMLAKRVSVFDENDKLISGVKRFVVLFIFSPASLPTKIKILFNKEVRSHLIGSIRSFLFSSSKNTSKSLAA